MARTAFDHLHTAPFTREDYRTYNTIESIAHQVYTSCEMLQNAARMGNPSRQHLNVKEIRKTIKELTAALDDYQTQYLPKKAS